MHFLFQLTLITRQCSLTGFLCLHVVQLLCYFRFNVALYRSGHWWNIELWYFIMTLASLSKCVYWYAHMPPRCTMPKCSLIVTMVTHFRLTKVICHRCQQLMKCVYVCVCHGCGRDSCFSSVCNIDRPCNEFLVPPPPQFDWEVHWLWLCVYVCVLTPRKWMPMVDKIKQTSNTTVHYCTQMSTHTLFECITTPWSVSMWEYLSPVQIFLQADT